MASCRWSMASLGAALPSPPLPRPPLRVVAAFPSRSQPRRKTTPMPRLVMRSFSGLAPLNPLHSLDDNSEFGSSEHSFPSNISFGCRISCMRHGRRVPKLNRPADQRKALLRGLTTQLLKYGRIKTTRARASAMRKYVDKMITLAKDGSLHKRRQALGFIYEKQLVHAMFAEVPDRYGERNGGYTRIIRTMPRRGDNAPMAYIELVD